MTRAQAHQVARHAAQTAAEPDQKQIFHPCRSFGGYL